MGTGIIYMDDTSFATDALFGKPLQATQDYISGMVNRYVDTVRHVSNDYAQSIVERFKEIKSAANVLKIDRMRHRLNSTWQLDAIRPMYHYEDIQMAPPSMQRWVMANPNLREVYNRGGCSGYEESYVDNYPGTIGETHYDYRRVMDGVVDVRDNDAVYTQYREKLFHEDDRLSIMDKRAILSTWAVLDLGLEESNLDPTSIWNELLA